jgi:hypothetical protein
MPSPTVHHEVDSIYTPEQKLRRIERIKRKVVVDANGCWIYHGQTLASGYVHIRFGNRLWAGHRLMYAMAREPIPPGMFVCHRCDVRNCINPDHLWLGTPKQNSVDASQKGRVIGQTKQNCPLGHPLSGENLYVSSGRRHCRACRKVATLAYYTRTHVRKRGGPYRPYGPRTEA